ncbi:hypothetical protein [uncultured Thiocystis sp.]|jgi:hypothetical protein|uniref:hypothetical protein n=1 Tax=uncultured Thiocystis sp. TaxID=1202134 RepID=UPI0025DE626A|nr:hypothetical protein [uncultured Thiocystis sp.]
MTRPSATEVILLCEDQRHEQFCRRFLLERGVSARRIRACIAPAGRGDAKQWVIDRYPQELRAYRSKANRINNALIVMTDLDQQKIGQRRQTLQIACQAVDVADVAPGERILIALPKWAIETWILTLVGQTVAEDERIQPTHKQRAAGQIRVAAKLLATLCASRQGGQIPETLSALHDTCSQFHGLRETL